MAPEARIPSVLLGEDSTMGANQEEQSARAGCTEFAVSHDCPDSERIREEGVEQGGTAVESAARATGSAGKRSCAASYRTLSSGKVGQRRRSAWE